LDLTEKIVKPFKQNSIFYSIIVINKFEKMDEELEQEVTNNI